MPVSYISDCHLLRALARVLELPAVATTTAFTYLHRIRCSKHECQLTGQELITACIYVAAKVEEVHVSPNQLLNTARILSHDSQKHLLQSLAPLPPSPATTSRPHNQLHHHQQQQQPQILHQPNSQHAAASTSSLHELPQQQQQQQQTSAPIPVVGEQYYQAKEQLFLAEQIVLRLMNFQLGVQQPHKHLFNFCKLLSVSQAVAAAAVCLLNDVVAYTACCVEFDAVVIAAAALKCTCQLMLGSNNSLDGGESSADDSRPHLNEQRKDTGRDVGKAEGGSADCHRQQQEQQRAQGYRYKAQTSPEEASNHQQHKQQDRDFHRYLNMQQEQQQQESLQQHSSKITSSVQIAMDGSWIQLIGFNAGEQQQVEELQKRLVQLITAGDQVDL